MLKKWLHSVFLMLLLGVVANVFADAKAVQKSTSSIFNTANTHCEIKMMVDGLCFTGETPIQLADYSTRSIKDIKDGDEVLAYNHKTHKTISQKVKNVFKKTTDSLARVAIGASVFMSTLNHPYFANGKYTEARDLHIGDSVLTVDGDYEKITGFETFDTVATVYNFEVETEHNYFIGEEGLLVHNACAATQYNVEPCKLLEIEELLRLKKVDLTDFQNFWNHIINSENRAKLSNKLWDSFGTDHEKMAKFVKDFGTHKDLWEIAKHPEWVDAWEVFLKSNVDDVVRTNVKVLEDADFILKSSKLNFNESSLETLSLLSSNKGGDLPEIIENLKYFEKYADNTGADQILKNIIKDGTFEANTFAIKAIKRADEVPDLFKGTIEGFEVLVDPTRKFTVDILTTNGTVRVFNELKSWKNFNPQYGTQFTKQFSNYLKNIEEFDQLKYLFEGKGRYVRTNGDFEAAKQFLKADLTDALKNNRSEITDALSDDKLVKFFGDDILSDDVIESFVDINFTRLFEIID